MENKIRPSFYFRVGLFVLGAAALLITALIALGASHFFRPKLLFETYIASSVQGIDIGSPVKFRGLTIGKVSNLEFTFNIYPQQERENAYNYVRVVMEIDRPVFPGMLHSNMTAFLSKTIKRGLRIRIEPLGVTGASYLNFDYVNPDRYPVPAISWTPKYTYIPSAPGEVTGLLDSVNKIMRDLETTNLGNMAQNLALLFNNVNHAIDQLRIQQLRDDIDALIVQLERTTRESRVHQLSSRAAEFLDQSCSLVQNLDRTNQAIQKTLSYLNPIAGESRDTVRNLRIASENLRQTSEDIKTRPSLILYGKPPSQKKR
ncbi:MAG: hypothetical protein C5B47_08515 [Verrucomicrobia bacterium]|nr:MAG: hypothetical protein C5B47_08515 [Verrucomicrobiota bacterium]